MTETDSPKDAPPKALYDMWMASRDANGAFDEAAQLEASARLVAEVRDLQAQIAAIDPERFVAELETAGKGGFISSTGNLSASLTARSAEVRVVVAEQVVEELSAHWLSQNPTEEEE